MIDAVSLAAVDAMGVVADAARRPNVDYVPTMQGEALVIENALTAVASVAQCIGFHGFRRKILGLVVANQKRCEKRSMRTIRPGAAGGTGVVAVVTVRASNHTARAKRRDQTDHVRVPPRSRHGMEGGIG